MFASMGLGKKIGVGFVSLILIAVFLGGLAVWNMKSVTSDAKKLAREYVPEVIVANHLERTSRATMYAARGYSFTEEQKYIDEGLKNLEEVHEYLEEANTLANESKHLVKLKDQIAEATNNVNTYESLLNETITVFNAMKGNREQLDIGAKLYIDNCTSFLESQNAAMKKECSSGAGSSKLKERHYKITEINNIIDTGNAVRLAAWRAQATRNPQTIREAISNFDSIDDMIKNIRKVTRQSVNIKELDNIQKAANQYKTAMLDFEKNFERAQELGTLRNSAADKVLAATMTTANAGIDQTEAIADGAVSALSAASFVMIIGLIIAAIIGAFLAVYITRSITGPINMIIDGLSTGSDQVAAASNQVSSSSQQLAEGSSEQASSLEEISSSLEEMTSMTKQNAENARQSQDGAVHAQSAADTGNKAMQRMKSTIDKIKTSSDETAKIIKTIDEIAFQTNLLALNAAVEAARAGEAGAGFAVVAEEVRNLALRSAEAAKNTSSLIAESQENANEGVSVTNEVADALMDISESSKKVAALAEEVSNATSEQSQGITQVNAAVSQMDQVTQTAAANAEESASASEELSSQASEMKDMVSSLIRLVEGQDSKNGSNGNRLAAVARPALPASGKKKKMSTAGLKTTTVTPNDVIPLDDDDFGEF